MTPSTMPHPLRSNIDCTTVLATVYKSLIHVSIQRFHPTGIKSKKLQRNKESLPQASAHAQELSVCTDMAQVRSKHKPIDDHSEKIKVRAAPQMKR